MTRSLTSETVHGLKWSYASTFVNVGVQIGVTAVLARLLTPGAFGLVAMAAVFLRFGQYFAQLGASQAVVQKAELSVRDVRTAFTSSLIIGIAFCGLFLLLAPLAGTLFPQTPNVVPVARVMSLSFVISGLMATPQGLLQRAFAFRAIALTEIASYVLGYAIVGLTLAAAGLGAWSLVAAALGQATLAAMTLTFLCRRDIGFAWHGQSFKSIYSFGGRVSFIGFAEFLGSNLDTLWAGHYLGSSGTGLYTRATNIANVPLYYLTVSLSRVLLPGYSRIQLERDRLASVYLATLTVIGAVCTPLAWGLAGASQEVVLTLLGAQWSTASGVLAILALAVPFTLLTHFGAVLCEAMATLNVKAVITVGRIAWLAVLLVVMARFGIVGIATAYALSELITHFAYLLLMRRLLTLSAAGLWQAHTIGLVAGIVTGVALFGIHICLTEGVGWPAPAVLAVQVAVGALCLLLTLTRARGGLVWKEIRGRLAEAGYRGDSTGSIAWLIRRFDALR